MSFKSIPLVVSLQLLIIAANGQKVSLSVQSAKVETVFGSIRNQTNYIINYNSRLVRRTNPVSINVKNADVDYVLDLCCKDQIITYTIKGNVITIKKRPRIINERPEQRDTVLEKVQAKEETERNSKWL